MAQVLCQETTPAVKGPEDGPLDSPSHPEPSVDTRKPDVLEASPDVTKVEHEEGTHSVNEHSVAIPRRPLLCRNVMSRDNIWTSLDGHVAESIAVSDSEPDFTSDSDAWSDDGEDESDEYWTSIYLNDLR